MLRQRFQGALVGALIGDCLGCYWEMMSWKGTHPLEKVKAKITEQVQQTQLGKAPVISYTDDTAMTLVMAQSLIDCKGFDPEDMGKKFTDEFFAHPERGYGASVSTVFSKLRNNQLMDLYGPAQQQFKGQGSCGNGGAMRIAPTALYGLNDDNTLIKVARDSTKLTHAHPSGINGAILQAMAVKLALQTPEGTLDPLKFVKVLMEKILPFEEGLDEVAEIDEEQEVTHESKTTEQAPVPQIYDPSKIKIEFLKGQPKYKSRLQQIEALLLLGDSVSIDEVEQLLGHGVLAGEAVPCALYAFLNCCKGSFEELIPFAISLGGDTDTIASMAGAMGGAYWGINGIPLNWIGTCEKAETARHLADQLYDLVTSEPP